MSGGSCLRTRSDLCAGGSCQHDKWPVLRWLLVGMVKWPAFRVGGREVDRVGRAPASVFRFVVC